MIQKSILFLCSLSFLYGLTHCASTHIKSYSGTAVMLTDSAALEDSASTAIIAPYKLGLDSIIDKVLNISDVEMVKDKPESLLGNFVSDACLAEANRHYRPADGKNADFCVLNSGGLRASLPKGEITLRNIYELMPFENKLVVLTLSGEKCRKLFNYIANADGQPVAGLRLTLEGEKVEEAIVDGKAFNPEETYKVVTSDYLAGKGDHMQCFENPIMKEEIDYKIRDAIVAFIEREKSEGRHLSATFEGRIKYAH